MERKIGGSLHKTVIFLVLLLLGGTSSFAIGALSYRGSNQVMADETKRYFSLMLLNLPEERGIDADLIPMAHSYGMNSVYLTIPWDRVVRTSPTGPRHWEKYDEEIQLALSLGMKVALRIHLGRNTGRIAGFWEPGNSQADREGRPLFAGYGDTAFSFAHAPSVEKGADFVKEVLNRYKYLEDQGNLLFVSVTTTTEQEGGYSTLYANEHMVYDYSGPAISGFRSWLSTKYKKIARLNRLWGGTNYKSFDEVMAPVNYDPYLTFTGRRGKDWYIYRHLMLKGFIDKMESSVKSVDSRIKHLADFGSVFDDLSRLRGTLGFKDLTKELDGVKVNDSNYGDHRFPVDLLRSEAPNKIIANEVFQNESVPLNIFTQQINENFEHGANMVAFLISTIETMKRVESVIRAGSHRWSNTTWTPISYQDTVNYRMSQTLDPPGIKPVMEEWKQKSTKSGGHRPVKVILEEDLLHPDYWSVVVNEAPYLLYPLPMQIVRVGTTFSYAIPEDTFFDTDGQVVKVEALNLPPWLRFEAGKITGRSDVVGDTRVLVRATDDEGASADAYFTIRVDNSGTTNVPPTVQRNLPNLSVVVDESFVFLLPNGLFQDADGQIVRVEAKGLPDWLAFNGQEFTGAPDTVGDYKITLTAFDNRAAFVETFFTVKVVSFQNRNKPPTVKNPMPIRFGMVNVPFEYDLTPENIFEDEDGDISLISVQNAPAWLKFRPNTFSGVPVEEEEYRIIVRAYDNSGGFVDAPFTIKVENPSFRFDLVKAGRPIDRERVHILHESDFLKADSLPPYLTIYAYGNFEFDWIELELNGPIHHKSKALRLPYSLFSGSEGFAPYIGNYSVSAAAFKNDSLIFKDQIRFTIYSGDSLNIAGNLDEWQFFPNPFTGVINVKLPDESVNVGNYQYALVTTRGERFAVTSSVNVYHNLAQIDLTRYSLATGIYFLEVIDNGKLLQRFKLVKK
jgi:hypothetical protein